MTRQQKERIQYLLLRFMADETSAGERMELSGLLKEETDRAVWEELLEEIYQAEAAPQEYNEAEWKPVLEHLMEQNRRNGGAVKPPSKRITLTFRRIAVAASIVLVIGLGSYFLFFNKSTKQDDVAVAETKDVKAPETNRAMITLADGRIVYLDSAVNGELVQQGNIKLVKLDNGQIAYQTVGGEGLMEIKYNTLNNPRGSKAINMTLADGSTVWLNAGSSVTFPIAFVGNERKVSITGEAYFEVTHDNTKPFFVTKGNVQVQVLGTHFNVNAYDDEQDIKVTLLEGSVNVTNGIDSETLKPGQQAQVAKDIKVTSDVDLQQVMAWKNGLFNFEGTNIEDILRQVERWYNVKIEYQVKTDGLNFSGVVSRKENVSEILKIMELTGLVHFTIEGNQITVVK